MFSTGDEGDGWMSGPVQRRRLEGLWMKVLKRVEIMKGRLVRRLAVVSRVRRRGFGWRWMIDGQGGELMPDLIRLFSASRDVNWKAAVERSSAIAWWKKARLTETSRSS